MYIRLNPMHSKYKIHNGAQLKTQTRFFGSKHALHHYSFIALHVITLNKEWLNCYQIESLTQFNNIVITNCSEALETLQKNFLAMDLVNPFQQVIGYLLIDSIFWDKLFLSIITFFKFNLPIAITFQEDLVLSSNQLLAKLDLRNCCLGKIKHKFHGVVYQILLETIGWIPH